MLDPSKVWTGALNTEAVEECDRWVGLYDTTLRDGEQTVGVTFSPQQKLEIALALDRLGVDRIEAGFPRVSEEDAEAYRLIMGASLKAEVWGFSRAVPADIQQLVDLGVSCTIIESPVSDGKIKAYGLTRDTIIDRVSRSVRTAVGSGMKVCFFAVDSTRADRPFLMAAYAAALEAGATEVAVVDTLGIAAPEAAASLVADIRTEFADEVSVHWHGHNDFGLGVACSLAAARAGADWVQGTINGMGERAGNSNLGEFALAFEALYGGRTSLDFIHLVDTCDLVRRHGDYEIEPYKPISGETVFRRESGAVAAQFHEPSAVEPYSSDLVGATRDLVLGKKSGIKSIEYKVAALGIEVAESEFPGLLAAVKSLAVQKRSIVSDGEFRELIDGVVSD
jgi:isopropylmalate/homocitrate/citramalate synthase